MSHILTAVTPTTVTHTHRLKHREERDKNNQSDVNVHEKKSHVKMFIHKKSPGKSLRRLQAPWEGEMVLEDFILDIMVIRGSKKGP